ncbi:IAA-amino acid conjugate hydrolase [Aureococcus anophagefferens]|nr:IAA-amino acid conjugate hydrolase [Aureococcus anophagefferens]
MTGSASLARSARRFASATTPPGAFSRERLAAWRHALHRQPELGFDLFKTSQFVADTLASFGGDMDITRGLGGTGVVASLRGGAGTSGRGIALRADMDALPIFEEADVMVKDGLFRDVAADATAVYGLHNWPGPSRRP